MYICTYLITIKLNIMTEIKIKRFDKVLNTDGEMLRKGIVAFQLVKFEYSFFGSKEESVLDTKIMTDGSQIVIDGDGFIKQGFQL